MKTLDNIQTIRKYDHSDMAGIIASFPRQCSDAEKIGDRSAIPASYKIKYQNIVCTGLGGSAIGADIVRSYTADHARTPIFVNRNYTLPAFVDRNSLVIVSSYSGNTEETISAFKDARSKRARIIVITSGGKLKELALRSSISVIGMPSGFQPRAAIGYSFFILLKILSRIGVVADKTREIHETIRVLTHLDKTSLGIGVNGRNNIAKNIAAAIYGKMPIIYADQDHMDAVSTRWRGQLAENAKTIASTHVFPEMTHNEIVGWDNPKKALKNLAVIMLRDRGDNPRIIKRMDIVKKIITGQGVDVIEVDSIGKGFLARVFSLIYIGDYVSLYLSILNRCDPTPVDRIIYLKKELAKR